MTPTRVIPRLRYLATGVGLACASLSQSIEFLPKVDKLSNYVLNSEIGVETDIAERLSLRVVAQDTYRSDSAPGRKQNDLKLVAGVGCKL